MWVAHPDLTPLILEHYNKTFDFPETSKGAEARVVGKIRSDKQYIVHSNGEIIIDAPAEQVTKGFLYNRPYSKTVTHLTEPDILEAEGLPGHSPHLKFSAVPQNIEKRQGPHNRFGVHRM